MEPNTQSAVLGKYLKGRALKVIVIDPDWGKIEGQEGFVSLDFLNLRG